jgi:hypothetical protein
MANLAGYHSLLLADYIQRLEDAVVEFFLVC